jgi:hypothetical protein
MYKKFSCTFIYALIDPISLEVRYVGKADNPHSRYLAHLRELTATTHKICWLKSLIKQNLKPILQILEQCGKERKFWKPRETDWIAFYKKIGCDLTNSTNGGDGFSDPTGEIAKKISASKKGKHLSEEHKIKLSITHKGKKFSEKHKANIRAVNKGKHLTEGHKTKLSIAHKGKHLSEEHKANISIGNTNRHSKTKKLKTDNNQKQKKPHVSKKGIPRSEETKRKISIGHKGKKLSEETKRKLSIINKGKKLSEEHKANISIGTKAGIAKKKLMQNEETKLATLNNTNDIIN